MMKFERIRLTVTAQQWKGKLKDIEVAKIRQIQGMTGYNGKLAYYDKPDGNVITIRPGDWIVKMSDDTIKIMSSEDFIKEYREVAKGGKSTNNSTQSKKSEDNFLEK